MSDALAFANRTRPRCTLLAHHDPYHTDDELDTIHESARRHWHDLGNDPDEIGMATELCEIEVGSRSRAWLRV